MNPLGKKVLAAVFGISLIAGPLTAGGLPLDTFRPLTTAGFLNNSKISLKNQFLFSFTAFDGASFLQNMYLSTFSYKPSAFWTLSLDLGATKFSGLSGRSFRDLTSPVLPLYALQAQYLGPSKKTRFTVNFGNTGSALVPGNRFAGPAGKDFLKNNDWSLQYDRSFFDDKLNVSIFYGHSASPR